MTEGDEKLKVLDCSKKALCEKFRRELSALLNEEREILGLTKQEDFEIEIYY